MKGDPGGQNSEYLDVYLAWKEIWLEVWIHVHSWPWLMVWSGTWKEHNWKFDNKED